jgi:light-harvesting complex I chlorophyll a/b binding protein 1
MILFTVTAFLLRSAAAFRATSADPSSRVSVSLQASVSGDDRSKALPFLIRPAALDGSMAGDVGFDPFNLSATDEGLIDLYWLREAELKHCRVAMLASLGFVWQEFFGPAPGCEAANAKNQVVALKQLWVDQPFVCGSFLSLIVLAEIVSGVAIEQGKQNGRGPGDYNFDPLGFGKNPTALERYKLNEVKNGRLAMWGAVGMLTQATISDEGALQNFFG